MPEPNVSCSLDLAGQEKRFAEFAELASVALLEAARTADGARLLLRRGDSVRESLSRLIEAERRCCSFLVFGVEEGEDGIRVEVSGPPSARDLIDRLFDLDDSSSAGAGIRPM